jgi:hypothetical protein
MKENTGNPKAPAQGAPLEPGLCRPSSGLEQDWSYNAVPVEWKTLKHTDLDQFVQCSHAETRHERKESQRFKGFAYDDLLKRDKVNLDIFWLRDESLEDSANLPDPDVLALEIAEELEAALEQFAAIAEGLKR